MRTQQLLPLCGLLLASVAIASKLDHDDVPNRCWPACGPVVGIANSCDARHERDSAEIQCICDWDAAKTQIPLCAACITQYQTDRRNHNITHHDHDDDDDHDDDHDYDNDNDNDIDDDDNEALDLVRYCSLTTTTYNSAAATTVSTSTSTAGANTATTTDSSNAPTGTDSAGTGGSNSQDSTGLAGASAGSASSPTPTPDAAAGILAPGAASMAGVMGLMALAWL